MGNALGARKKYAKVMMIDGETTKLKVPIKASEVLKDHPGLVLLESESVKHYGIRAKPLEPHKDLVPKRLYFLIELPEVPKQKFARRVRSEITMSAKDRLESLMLARRSTSDLSIIKESSVKAEVPRAESDVAGTRVKMRLPKAEIERLMKESSNEDEIAEKIVKLCVAKNGDSVVAAESGTRGGARGGSRQLGRYAMSKGNLQRKEEEAYLKDL